MGMENKKIIIVDDDDRNIFALKAVLKAKGFTCVAATSAGEGLEILQQTNDIGIALIDMMMPGMDGYQMISAIKKIPALNGLPLIAVTAQAMVGDKEKCLRMGADDYIAKPINVDLLLKILNKHLTDDVSIK
jgi:two-component system cell cycle response regulator DivK